MRRKEEKKNVVEASEYQMFSEVDMTKEGSVGSYLPAWAYDQLIGDLESEIHAEEQQMRAANISVDKINELRRSVDKKKERLHEINESRPNVDVDKVRGVVDGLSEKISDSMFSRTDMMKGLADAHVEARRMTEPCIKLSDAEANFALGCNVVPTRDKMISRNQATKIWKIGRKYIGELSNVEVLRRG